MSNQVKPTNKQSESILNSTTFPSKDIEINCCFHPVKPMNYGQSKFQKYKYDSFFSKGIKLQQKEKFSLSIDEFKKALRVCPNKSDVYIRIADSYYSLEQFDRSILYYDMAKKIIQFQLSFFNESNINKLVPYNHFQFIARLQSQVVKMVGRLQRNKGYIYYKMGNIHLQQSKKPQKKQHQYRINTQKAIQCYQTAIQLSFKFEQVYINLAIAYQNQHRPIQQIERCYKKGLSRLKYTSYRFHNNFGNLFYRLRDYQKAIQCFLKSLQLNPQSHEAYNNLGRAYFQIGSQSQALICYQNALIHNSQCDVAYINIGNLFSKQKKAKAVQYYKNAVRINQKNIYAYCYLGNYYYQNGCQQQAIKQYKKAGHYNKLSSKMKLKMLKSVSGQSQMLSLDSLASFEISDISTGKNTSKLPGGCSLSNGLSYGQSSIQSSVTIKRGSQQVTSFLQSQISKKSCSKDQGSIILPQLYDDYYYSKIVELKDVKFLENIQDYHSSPHILQKYRRLVLKNHLDLIKYLSKNKSNTNFIAQYYFQQEDVQQRLIRDQFFCYKFSFKMQKGLSQFSIDTTQQFNENYIKILWRSGIKEVLLWIKCFLKGIIQLQQLGIFHPDLCLRNTIKIKDPKQSYTFKIIDFDYAFKVAAAEHRQITIQQKQCFENTKLFFDYWLQQPQTMRNKCHIIPYIFPFLNKYRNYTEVEPIDKVVKQINNQTTVNQLKQKKVMNLVNELKKYMFFYHKLQAEQILKQLFKMDEKNSVLKAQLFYKMEEIRTTNQQQNIRGYREVIQYIDQFEQSELLQFDLMNLLLYAS